MPPLLRNRRRADGFAAVVAVGFANDPEAVRIAATEDVENHLFKIQPGRWEPLHFSRIVWTQGIAVAKTVAAGAERTLIESGQHLGNHWFRTPLPALDVVVLTEVTKLRATIWTHDELKVRLRHQLDKQADRYAMGHF